jgi:hypothetical protein
MQPHITRPKPSCWRHVAAVLALAVGISAERPGIHARQGSVPEARRNAYDELLDLNVRDGFVYYRALKGDRRRLDAYVESLASAPIGSAPRDEQIAFWLNAYNALVLRTVVDHYPIVQRTKNYPPRSIRQVPGAFDRLPHRVAGQTLTLDQIEQTVLPRFQDPRLFLALGRGAVGSGRLRSEAYAASRLEEQLVAAAAECLANSHCVNIDRGANQVQVSSIFSWREKDFVQTYASQAPALFGARSPIERAVLAFVDMKLLTTEREFLEKNAFEVEYAPFDWSLNDLTGRGGR